MKQVFLTAVVGVLASLSISALALDSGVYRRVDDLGCYQMVNAMDAADGAGWDGKGQFVWIESLGNCSGSVMLMCSSKLCFGTDDSDQQVMVSPISGRSYVYRAGREAGLFTLISR